MPGETAMKLPLPSMCCQATTDLQHNCAPSFHLILTHLLLPVALVTPCLPSLQDLKGRSALPCQGQVMSVCCSFLMSFASPFQTMAHAHHLQTSGSTDDVGSSREKKPSLSSKNLSVYYDS